RVSPGTATPSPCKDARICVPGEVEALSRQQPKCTLQEQILLDNFAASLIAFGFGDCFKTMTLTGVLALAGIFGSLTIGSAFAGSNATAMYFGLFGMHTGRYGNTTGK
ncbi:MAG TPA: hypothetical protein VLC91_07770, partial [Spongiibacteraceae bacterium]|nr:hypothetical protein [Spongiibacteraceae bacterium]